MKKNSTYGLMGNICLLKMLKMMRFTIFILLLSLSQVFAVNSYSQETKLSLDMRNARVEEVIDRIEKNSEFFFMYNKNMVDIDRKVDIQVEEKNVNEVLDKIFENTDISYSIKDRQILLINSHMLGEVNLVNSQQQRSVSGKVSDSSGTPVPGASVVVKGTSIGVSTANNGTFTLVMPIDAKTLVFSFVGMKSQEVAVGNQTTFNIKLVEDAVQLEAVVAVGYGTQRKGELTVSVSQIKGEQFRSIPATSFKGLIGGRAAGVDVISTSGAPGTGSTIRIRGANSVNSDASPLYVIDGFPIVEEPQDFSTDRIATKTDPLSMINPNDIESVEILKDAAATSIYGSRGANGVILIKTKEGRLGKSELNVTASIGVDVSAKQWKLMNSAEFSSLLYDAYSRGGINMANLAYDPTKKLAIPVDYNTNWQDEIMQTARIQDYNITSSGANETSKYSFSLGYNDSEGIIKSNMYKRYSARFNGETKAWKNRIVVGLNSNISYVDQKSHYGTTSSAYDIALKKAPNIPLRFPEGTRFAGYYSHSETVSEWDVLWGKSYGCASSGALNLNSPFLYIDHAKAPSNQARILVNSYMSIEPVKGLIFKTSLGADLNYSKSKFLNQSEGPFRIANGDLQHDQNQTYTWLVENTLTYSGKIDKHSFTALLGQSGQKYYQEGLGFWVQEQTAGKILVSNNPFFVSNWYFDTGVQDHMTANHKYATTSDWNYASYFGRFNYSYDGKYLVTATVRKDGSSKFGKDSKWGTFPGMSLAWNLHKESFFKVPFVDHLKVRGSWGVVGNGNIPSYLSQSLLVTTPVTLTSIVIQGPNTYQKGLVDPALKWESTRQLDFGFDASLFNRLNITSDVYFKKTYDLLYPKTIPLSTGFPNIAMTNLGDIEQVGFELSLSGNIIQAMEEKDFNWFGSLNIDHMTGKVTSLPPNVTWVGSNIRSYLNEPMGHIYGYKVDGIYNTQAELDSPTNPYKNAMMGDYRYRDLGSTDAKGKFVMVPDGQITAADRVDLGSALPVVSFGFQNTFTYKCFDLNLFFRSSIGNKIYNQSKRDLLNSNGNQNILAEAVNRWTPDNHSQTIQAANSNRKDPVGAAPLDIFVEDGSFLRLSNLNLGYTLPRYVIDHIGIKSLRVYGSISNVFVLTGYSGLDPDISGGDVLIPRGIDTRTYPKTRTFSVGLNVSF